MTTEKNHMAVYNIYDPEITVESYVNKKLWSTVSYVIVDVPRACVDDNSQEEYSPLSAVSYDFGAFNK